MHKEMASYILQACDFIQIIKSNKNNYLTESKTILVVADISLVTLMPAKLKKAMEMTVPKVAIKINGLFPETFID